MRTFTGFKRESIRRTVNKRWFGFTIVGGIVAIVLLGALFLVIFERNVNPEIDTYSDALWLSFVTMTTVGYGDKVPVTIEGKLTAVAQMVFGLGLLTIFITSRASAAVESAARRAKGLDEKTRLRNHFVVLGWNQRGEHMIRRLSGIAGVEKTPIVLLAQLDGAPFDNEMLFFYHGNPASDTDQRRVNLAQARSVVLLADELLPGSPADRDARTVLAALTAQAINPYVRITAEVLLPENVQHLRRAGVDEVLDHNVIAGNLLAQSAVRFGMVEIITALAKKRHDTKVYNIPVKPEMIGKNTDIIARAIDEHEGFTLLGIRGHAGLSLSDSGAEIREGDMLLVLADADPTELIGKPVAPGELPPRD